MVIVCTGTPYVGSVPPSTVGSLPENLHIVSQVRVNYRECCEVSQELSHKQVPETSII
jgi:hypothetical protein